MINRYKTMDITSATTIVSKKESKNCPIEEKVAAIFSVGVNFCFCFVHGLGR